MMSFLEELDTIRSRFLDELSFVSSTDDLERVRVAYFGKKGHVASLMVSLKNTPKEDRPKLGKVINDLKKELSSHIEHSFLRLQNQEQERQIASEAIDVTLPGKKSFIGIEHPTQKVLNRSISIFSSLGFSVALGPELDTDHYNFEGLNFSPDHPAREMQDTFYFPGGHLLRTHTSNVQVHLMEKQKPPMRIIAPGKCFRNETVSSRSHVFFHQIEGFCIDTEASFADLCSLMRSFWKQLFGRSIKVRFRPSYFPFVEPGMEVDIECLHCSLQGCKLCKHTGWLEVAGAGMIHPNVLETSNIDPEKYSGYAWGIGIERIAMLLYGIGDIRTFSENDSRLFEQVAWNS